MTQQILPTNVLIVHKPLAEAATLAQAMQHWLEARHCVSTIMQSGAEHGIYESVGAQLVVVL
ncbi:MAG: hypothetical protein RRY29_00585, partial [Desulfovibrionaceae bacterium]